MQLRCRCLGRFRSPVLISVKIGIHQGDSRPTTSKPLGKTSWYRNSIPAQVDLELDALDLGMALGLAYWDAGKFLHSTRIYSDPSVSSSNAV